MITKPEFDIEIAKPIWVVKRNAAKKWSINNSEPRGEDYMLAYNFSGIAHYKIGDKAYTVRKGDVIFLRGDDLYTGYSDIDDPWTFISIRLCIKPRNLESKKLLENLPNVMSFGDNRRISDDFNEVNNVWTLQDSCYVIKCRSLILNIFSLVFANSERRSSQGAHNKRLSEIIDMMSSNYNKSFSIDELCKLSGLSSSHFRALFKKTTGLSAIQFQNQIKINKAKDLLISHTCNVTEASEAVGFSDVYYFSRTFRKLTGKNPSDYL